LADSVYDALTPQVHRKPTRTEPPAARHPLAFELYLRATEKTVCFAKFELGATIEMLEKAVDLDPNFSDAWGMLSIVCCQMGAHIDPDPKWFSRAEQAISRALELDPINCDAFCARGIIHFSASRGFQLASALRALNASLKINPGGALARAQRAGVLFHLGFHEAALEDFDECIFASPEMAFSYAARSLTEIFMGNYAVAEDHLQRALAFEPTLVHAHLFVPLPAICQKNLEKAWEKLRKTKQMIPEEPQIASLEGLILACEGNFSRAEQLADEAVASKRSMVHSHHTWHVAAGVYAVCGKPEKAIAELKRCSQNGLPNHRAFEADPHLRSLHTHPDFVALMRDLRHEYESFRKEFDVSEVYVPRHTTSPR
jgi:eukaryotic-like serine/threonine-protein kinase